MIVGPEPEQRIDGGVLQCCRCGEPSEFEEWEIVTARAAKRAAGGKGKTKKPSIDENKTGRRDAASCQFVPFFCHKSVRARERGDKEFFK